MKKAAVRVGAQQFEVAGWDPSQLDDVLGSVEEPHEQYSEASAVEQLRAAIVADERRHGEWLQLRQYKPMPRRIAQNIAMAWRRADPSTFEGDRSFLARIMPLDDGGNARRNLTITKNTNYTVAVQYPRDAQES